MSQSRLVLSVVTLFFGCLAPSVALSAQTYDVVIRGGRVLDGTGSPWFRADVALDGDRIAAIGDLSGVVGRTEIDAGGLYVSPGFIDAHSHAAGGLASEGLSHGRPLLAQGLTSVIVNPDGGGTVDLSSQRASLLEDGLGLNVLQLVPHGSVRRSVMGAANRAATEDEMGQMRGLVRAGMEEGAWGLSSGTFYVPGAFSDNAEIIDLAGIVAEFGGAYTSHIRDESNYTIGVIAAVEEVIDVGRQAGIPAVVTHIKALGIPVWGFANAIVNRIERAREEGVEVYGDQYPYTASATSLGAAIMPRWAQAGGGDSLRSRLADPAISARIRADMASNLVRRGGADRLQFRRVSFDESLEGKLLSDVARQLGEAPLETALDLILRGDAGVVSFNMSENDVRQLMVQPWTMMGSDGDLVPWMRGVPHPRSYGAFPHKIRVYARDGDVMSLAGAIRSMTGLTAQVFRIPDRGFLRRGAVADVLVFDLATVNDPATYADPHQLAEGMRWVFVNGTAAVADGEFTGMLAGRVLGKR